MDKERFSKDRALSPAEERQMNVYPERHWYLEAQRLERELATAKDKERDAIHRLVDSEMEEECLRDELAEAKGDSADNAADAAELFKECEELESRLTQCEKALSDLSRACQSCGPEDAEEYKQALARAEAVLQAKPKEREAPKCLVCGAPLATNPKDEDGEKVCPEHGPRFLQEWENEQSPHHQAGEKCRHCGGFGSYPVHAPGKPKGVDMIEETCKVCNGTGTQPGEAENE